MAETQNTIKTTVVLDTTSAQQNIVRLNAIATDSTKTLEERVEAKNKQVKIQEQLSKQTIDNLSKQAKSLKNVEGEEKNLEKVENKLNKARLQATKLQESGSKQQRKLNQSYKDGKSPVKNLDKATGGLLGKMQLFLTNPIGIILTALVGLFQLFKKSMNSTEDGAASLNAIMAAVGQVFTNIITIVSDSLQPILEWLSGFLSKDLGGAFAALGGYVDALKLGFKAWIGYISLLLTPLKLLIALAKSAAKAIKGDFEGAKQVMADFKQEVIDTASAIKDNLVKALDTVVKTNKKVSDSFNDSSDSADSLIARAAQIELRQNDYNKAKRAQLLIDAKLAVLSRRELAISKDKALSDEVRIEALKKFRDAEIKREEGVSKALRVEIQLQKDRMSLGGNTIDDEEKLNNLLIQRELNLENLAKQEGKFNAMMGEFVIQRESAAKKKLSNDIKVAEIKLNQLRENNQSTLEIEAEFLSKKMDLELTNEELTESDKNLIRLKHKESLRRLEKSFEEEDLEERARELEAQLTFDELQLEQKRFHGDNVLAEELRILDARMAQELLNVELTEQERVNIITKFASEKSKIIKIAEETDAEVRRRVNSQALAGAAEAFGIQREVAIAGMIMAAPQAIGDSFKSAAKAYAPPLAQIMGAAGAIAVVAPIIKGLADIKKVRFPGGKRGRHGGGGGSISASIGGASTSTITPELISSLTANNSARLGIDPNLGANAGSIASNNITGSSTVGVVFSESEYNDFQDQVSFKEDKISV